MAIGCGKKIPCYPPEHYAPESGAPYTAEEVRIPTSKGHTLVGTLTLPTMVKPPYPALLLITGSSPQERDHLQDDRYPVSLYRPFRQISDSVSRKGIAVLRVDDQGTGCSEGRRLEEVTIQERADDSRAEIQYLRCRKEINASRIGLLGLSEGANIASMIAASDPTIRAIVMMAPTATSGYKIIEYQRRLKINERTDLSYSEKEKELERSMNGLDHSELLAKVMQTRGNEDVALIIFSNHNHLFLRDPKGNISGYAALLRHTNQVPDDVLMTITDWLQRHLQPN